MLIGHFSANGLSLDDCEDDDDKEFLYKYIEFINQSIEKVLED